MNKFLIYQDSKGVTSVFEIEPRHIKGNNFSAKNIETGRQKSFSMNLTLGLFDTKDEAEVLFEEMESFQKQLEDIKPKSDKLREDADKVREKTEKLNIKIEKLNGQLEKLEERSEQKDEAYGNLMEKDDLTDKQLERFGKLEAELEMLTDKETDLSDKITDLEEEISGIEEEADGIEEEADKLESDIYNSQVKFQGVKTAECVSKIKALGLEVKEVKPRVKKSPPPLPRKNGKGLKIAVSIIVITIILVVVLWRI
jgi:chromosome segregation ATPase